jgi:hypothetical protein
VETSGAVVLRHSKTAHRAEGWGLGNQTVGTLQSFLSGISGGGSRGLDGNAVPGAATGCVVSVGFTPASTPTEAKQPKSLVEREESSEGRIDCSGSTSRSVS